MLKEKEQQKLELDRKLQEKQQKEKLEKDKLEKDKLQKAKDAKEKDAKDKLARDKAEKDKADKAKTADAAKQKTAQAKAEAQKLEDLRQQNLQRMAGLAGSGDSNAAGSAAKSAGPGASYFGRVAARIKPNVTYTDIITGNPTTEIEVTLGAGGDIQSKRFVKRSGNKAWDDAAMNAIEKTERLPLDNGKVWSPMTIVLSPQTLLGGP